MCICIINPNIYLFIFYLARNIVQEEQSETGGNFHENYKNNIEFTTIRKR